jgi:hypothetical protein
VTIRAALRYRPWAPIVLAIALASGFVAAPQCIQDVAAATPDLTLVGNSRYLVQPTHSRVRVIVDVTATNHLHDSQVRRYYFDHGFLAVLPGTSAFKLTSDSGNPSVGVRQRTRDYTLLQLNFGRRIYSGRSASFQLRFDLRDPGGSATRDVRVGSSLVSFPVWAFASPSTSGGSVAVVFPKGYSVTVETGSLPTPTVDAAGRSITKVTGIADPARFFAYVVGDRPGSYKASSLSVAVGGTPARLSIRSWADDADWGKRVKALLAKGLPVLGKQIGLPWTRQVPFEIQEAVSRTTGGYAGLFDPRTGRIEVAYYADALVILHEASHVWFNGSLLADRWSNEAFASYYALGAASRLKQKVTIDRVTPALLKARIPLNAWGAVGRDTVASEDYAYAASLEVARTIAKRAGSAGLQRVWADAAGRVAAYQPAGGSSPPETTDAAPDWRSLLDLLEEETGKSYMDLWRKWVVRPTEQTLLDERAAARAEFAAVQAIAGDWQLPKVVRVALRAWQFEQASELLGDARSVLKRRTDLQKAAADNGLTLPSQLEAAFESDAGFAAANAEADAEATVIEAIRAAAATRVDAGEPLVQLGLIGTTPDAILASARSAFASGDMTRAVQEADNAQRVWLSAEEIGRNRLLAALGLALIALMGLGLFVGRLRDRRRQPRLKGQVVRHSMAHRSGLPVPDVPPDRQSVE